MSRSELVQVVPAGECRMFIARCPYQLGQCVKLEINTEQGRQLLVMSIQVGSVEQLLGSGVPVELLASAPLQLDRQRASDSLVVLLQNDQAIDTIAEVVAEFVPVEALTLAKERLH